MGIVELPVIPATDWEGNVVGQAWNIDNDEYWRAQCIQVMNTPSTPDCGDQWKWDHDNGDGTYGACIESESSGEGNPGTYETCYVPVLNYMALSCYWAFTTRDGFLPDNPSPPTCYTVVRIYRLA
jgi:hypothetical protein